MTLTEHIERFVGQIAEAWSTDEGGKKLPFMVVRTASGPVPACCTYSTLGISDVPLSSSASRKTIRQEFCIVVRNDQQRLGVAGILQQVGLMTLASETAVLRGQLIGPFGELFVGSKMEALYAAIPVYFPRGFAQCDDERLGSVVFTWLVPISSQEARFTQELGWQRLEDAFMERNPDLANVFRDELKLCS